MNACRPDSAAIPVWLITLRKSNHPALGLAERLSMPAEKTANPGINTAQAPMMSTGVKCGVCLRTKSVATPINDLSVAGLPPENCDGNGCPQGQHEFNYVPSALDDHVAPLTVRTALFARLESATAPSALALAHPLQLLASRPKSKHAAQTMNKASPLICRRFGVWLITSAFRGTSD
jgi:hypothetical protein